VACVLPQTREGQAQGFRCGNRIARHRLRGAQIVTTQGPVLIVCDEDNYKAAALTGHSEVFSLI
jgi:hypothetical protein